MSWIPDDAWAGAPDGPPGAGGGGTLAAIPFAPLLGMTLGGMDVLDGFVTGVTVHGGGEYTLALDYTQARTFVGNGDLFRFDLITAWNAAGSQASVLEFKIEIISRPDNDAGDPFVALYHRSGAGPIRTGIGAVGALMFSAAGDSGRMISSLSTLLTVGGPMGNPSAFIMRMLPPIGAVVPQYGIDFRAIGTSETTTRWNTHMSSVALPTTVQIDNGYDVGSHLGVSFQQLVADTGTGSMRLRFSSRIVPLPVPE